MMNSDNHNSSNGKSSSSDGDQGLWDLMGQSRQVKVSRFFTRNVLREIRQERPKVFNVFAWFLRPITLAAVATIAILLAFVVAVNFDSSNSSTAEVDGSANFDLAEEMTSIGELGDLMAVTDPASLSDEAFLNLLY